MAPSSSRRQRRQTQAPRLEDVQLANFLTSRGEVVPETLKRRLEPDVAQDLNVESSSKRLNSLNGIGEANRDLLPDAHTAILGDSELPVGENYMDTSPDPSFHAVPNSSLLPPPLDTFLARPAEPAASIPPPPSTNAERNPGLRSIIPEIKLNAEYIELLLNAKLETSGMNEEDILRLRNPSKEFPFDPYEPAFLHSLRTFIACSNSSEQTYKDVQDSYIARHPDETFYSHYQVRRRVELLSGVVPIFQDMCVDTCVGFTGPYSDLESCPVCNKSRYDEKQLGRGKRVSRRQFVTIPIVPVIQAFYRSEENARKMQYFLERLQEMDTYLRTHTSLPMYDDTCCGQEFLSLFRQGKIKAGDIILQLSIDGAQLFRDKESDCWIYIYVVHNLSPKLRYTKLFVIPGGFIGGPNHPKLIESFIFPGLYHVAAIQKEGLSYWDAHRRMTVTNAKVLLPLVTADGVAMADISGSVGHTGKCGCRTRCEMIGRCRPGDGHYYPAMLRPNDYDVPGCNHNDITFRDLNQFRQSISAIYQANLESVCMAPNVTQYQNRRLQSGIVKPSIFSGLDYTLGIPNSFVLDIMHLADLNDPDLLLGLWRGTIKCYSPDTKDSWDWAVLKGKIWELHGETVARCTPYLPVSFGRCPRDPAQKINSGYKAWEYLIYIYGLGPALLRRVLPKKYWTNYCKLVRGMRLAKQYSITHTELMECNKMLCEFIKGFEELYYQRIPARIHFVRQSVHLLSHIAPEIYHVGPLPCYAQWTMETAIGNLGNEIRSFVDPYANIANRGILRAQINCLHAMLPDLSLRAENVLSKYATDLGNGYAFLPKTDKLARDMTGPEAAALRVLWEKKDWPNLDGFCNQVKRHGCLKLPNFQVIRTVWGEGFSSREDRRRATIAKILRDTNVCFGEVQYFFRLTFGNEKHALAMCSVFSDPDIELLEESQQTVYLCNYQGASALSVIPVENISSLVGMVPDFYITEQGTIEKPAGSYFLVEKPSLAESHFFGCLELVDFEGEQDEPGERDM